MGSPQDWQSPAHCLAAPAFLLLSLASFPQAADTKPTLQHNLYMQISISQSVSQKPEWGESLERAGPNGG